MSEQAPTDDALRGKPCPHARGEYSDDYQRCLDCGREVILINGAWFEVQGWIRVHRTFIEESQANG